MPARLAVLFGLHGLGMDHYAMPTVIACLAMRAMLRGYTQLGR
jgi:hypothetical protein